MIEGLHSRAQRRWPKLALGVAALALLSGATGWGAAHFAARSIASPDLAKVKAALKLRLPKTPIDAINCEGLRYGASGSHREPTSDGTLARLDAAERHARGPGRQPAFGKESRKSASGSAKGTPHPGPSPRGQCASFENSRSARRADKSDDLESPVVE